MQSKLYDLNNEKKILKVNMFWTRVALLTWDSLTVCRKKSHFQEHSDDGNEFQAGNHH